MVLHSKNKTRSCEDGVCVCVCECMCVCEVRLCHGMKSISLLCLEGLKCSYTGGLH